jgi:hypothetical protein
VSSVAQVKGELDDAALGVMIVQQYARDDSSALEMKAKARKDGISERQGWSWDM